MCRMFQLEAAAKAKAVERVSSLLQRPDQLEKVEEFRKREARKKASKEALMKTALQSQLDGVKTGLELLSNARTMLEEVGSRISQVLGLLQTVSKLSMSLDGIRQENFRHSQYAMAMENMSNIFNIDKNLKKAHQLISEGHVMSAHIILSELEASRDDLLFELFRNKSEHIMLLNYFDDVEKLSISIEQQVTLTLKRTINTARKEPAVLVAALRIIEREENADAIAIQRFHATDFMPPARPKELKEKAFKILENSVIERLEACQLETRKEDKRWLIRYLEVMRQIILEDLIVIKGLCVPCFPPSYSILETYIQMYHKCLSNLLSECISNGLEGNEYVSLLSWVLNSYTGPELLSNSQLGLASHEIPQDLLGKETLSDLIKDYLSNIRSNYHSWRLNTLKKEVEEWKSNQPPSQMTDGKFSTEAPIFIYQMVDENLKVAKTVSDQVVQEMLLLSFEMIKEYGQAYHAEVKDFKDRYFEDRSKISKFTLFMIAIINNCLTCIQLAHETKDRYWKSAVGDSKVAKSFEGVLLTFEAFKNCAANYLLDEAFLDLEPHFQNLITRDWLKSENACETICVTLDDYFVDYNHLLPKNWEVVMSLAKIRVASKYLMAIMSRKFVMKTLEERKEAGDKIIDEAAKLRKLFDREGSFVSSNKSMCPFGAIEEIAEVIKVEDVEMLELELHSFIKHYPDITKEQLMSVLSLRGDIGRFEVRQKASDMIPKTSGASKGHIPHTIFSQILSLTGSLK